MKRILNEYLSFTRRERVAVIVLLVLMGGFIALPYYYEPAFELPVADSALNNFLSAEPNAVFTQGQAAGAPAHDHLRSAALFHFDPNTISETGWQQLGISARLATTIVKYRSKGGRFRQAADLKKIWGMKPEMAERLIPYVTIGSEAPVQPRAQERFPKGGTKEKKKVEAIDVNLAQPDDWKSLPGIGDVLAERIVRYRERCGGFSSIDAVGTTYGIADTVFEKLRPYLKFDARNLPGVDLNQAGIAQLKNRLQLNYAQAKMLVRYREEHGAITSLAELKNIRGLADTTLERLAGLVRLN